MNVDAVLRNLRAVQNTAKNQVCTFEIRVADMAHDAADAIEKLQVFTNLITAMNSCNDCSNRTCGYCPKIGESVRYNCFLHKPILRA